MTFIYSVWHIFNTIKCQISIWSTNNKGYTYNLSDARRNQVILVYSPLHAEPQNPRNSEGSFFRDDLLSILQIPRNSEFSNDALGGQNAEKLGVESWQVTVMLRKTPSMSYIDFFDL